MKTQTKRQAIPTSLPVQHRAANCEVRAVDEEARTVDLAFSSEAEVERWYGVEILDHDPESIRLERIMNRGPVLMDHNYRDHVGVVESVSLDGRVGRARVRFGQSARASEVFRDVLDGIRGHVSVGYRIHKAVLVEDGDEGSVYRMTDWEPLELSLVSVPADPSVGVGRSESETETFPLELEHRTMEEDEETITADAQRSEPTPTPTPAPAPAGSGARQTEDAQRAGQAAERKRVNDVLAAGRNYNATDLALEVVASGGSVDDLRRRILETRHGQQPGDEVRQEQNEIGLTEREADQFSFTRLINAQASGGDSRAMKAAAFELDVCRTAAENLQKMDGEREARSEIVVPHDVLQRPFVGNRELANVVARMLSAKRDLVVGTATAGGNLVATDLLGASFIDILRNASVMMELGTVLDDLVGNIALPRQTAASSGGWLSAEQNAAAEQAQAFDQVTLSPQEVGAFTNYSRKLLIQSSINVEAFVRADLAMGIALALDAAAINGSGASGEPEGIMNATGIGAVEIATNGGALTWGAVVDLETEVATDNALMGRLAYVMPANVRGHAKQKEKASSTAQFIMPESGMELNGYAARVTNQVPTNLTKGSGTNLAALLFGNFADLLIGLWSGIDLLVNPYTGDTTRTTRVSAYQDADIALRHPESFAVCDDIDPTA